MILIEIISIVHVWKFWREYSDWKNLRSALIITSMHSTMRFSYRDPQLHKSEKIRISWYATTSKWSVRFYSRRSCHISWMWIELKYGHNQMKTNRIDQKLTSDASIISHSKDQRKYEFDDYKENKNLFLWLDAKFSRSRIGISIEII